jgi:hypothetical protein
MVRVNLLSVLDMAEGLQAGFSMYRYGQLIAGEPEGAAESRNYDAPITRIDRLKEGSDRLRSG